MSLSASATFRVVPLPFTRHPRGEVTVLHGGEDAEQQSRVERTVQGLGGSHGQLSFGGRLGRVLRSWFSGGCSGLKLFVGEVHSPAASPRGSCGRCPAAGRRAALARRPAAGCAGGTRARTRGRPRAACASARRRSPRRVPRRRSLRAGRRGRPRSPAGQHHRVLDRVFELAHVARERVLGERRESAGGDRRRLGSGGEPAQEVVDQQKQVAPRSRSGGTDSSRTLSR